MEKSVTNIQLENSLNELMAIVNHNNKEAQKIIAITEQTQKTLFFNWKKQLKAYC